MGNAISTEMKPKSEGFSSGDPTATLTKKEKALAQSSAGFTRDVLESQRYQTLLFGQQIEK